MKTSTYLVATVAVSCIAAASWLVQTQHRPRSRADHEELQSLRQELEALQQKMVSVDRRASATRWLERVARSAGDEEAVRSVEEEASGHAHGAEPSEPTDREESNEAERQASYLALVDEVFGSEPSDPSWRVQRELELGLQEKLPPESRIESLDCRTTLCRLITSHRDEQSYQTFIAGAFLPQAGESTRVWAGSAIFDAADSSATRDLRTTTYLVRENHALPTAGIAPEDGSSQP